MNTNPYISVKNIVHSVKMSDQDITILNDVHFNINAGESVAIVGESGAGKSTLLGLLAGLDLPDSGSIDIDGRNICAMNEDERAGFRAQNMGFVFQSFQLLPTYTALENVTLPLELLADVKSGSSTIQPVEQATEYLDKVGLSHRLHHYPHQLSGGEQQRVALARAFVSQPKLLFADEPTGNLDYKTSQVISDLMFSLNEQSHTTLVLITHELSLAERCQKVFTLSEGQIRQQSDVNDKDVYVAQSLA